jgi:CheY-like chemotaxis protein
MPKRDLDEALNIHSALMQIIVGHPGGRNDSETMERVSRLCASAVEAVNDLETRVIIRGIESLSRLLFYADGHVGIEVGSLRGVDALKFQILNALSNLRGRLQFLQHAPPSAPELPALSAKKDIHVLIVEDNADAAASLRKLLELCGYAVTVAATSRDGLEVAKQVQPDIVLCDIGLPDSDGYTLAAALRSNPVTARAKLVAVTAYGREQDKKRAREAGFQLHLVKPVKPETLLHELDKRARASSNGDC